MAESGERDEQDQQQRSRGTSPWEWVVAALSGVLVLGAIGFMLQEALSEPSSPPRIEIAVDTIIATRNGYVVEFRATNRGTTTAAGLTVEGELKSATGSVEKSEVTVQYVPAEASRQGGLFFSHDPQRYQLEIRPKGYARP